jgi:hypothetical protein
MAIATIITVLVFFVIGSGDGDANRPFYALYAARTIVWCISTALLFLDIFFAKRASPEKFEEARRIPVGWLYVCGAVGTVVNILAVLFIVIGSWHPESDSNPNGFTLAAWNTWMVVIAGISVISGPAIYAISQRTRHGKTDEQLLSELAPAGGAGGAQ